MHVRRLRRRLMSVRLEPLDEFSNVLIPATRGDQHHVRRRGYDEIFDAECSDERAFPPQITPLGIFRDDIADFDIFGRVLRGDAPERRPASDVVPLEIRGDDGTLLRVFHHRIIDGD